MLKSVECKKALLELKNKIKELTDKGDNVPQDLLDSYDEKEAEYIDILEKEQEERKNMNTNPKKPENKSAICAKVLKNLLMGKHVEADMVAESGIVGIIDAVGTVGNVESVGERGGYLVPEEFLELDKYGGEIVMIPARVIPVSLPKGKIPNVDMSQAKDGKFLAKHDELDDIGTTNPVFSQLTFDCETYTGVVPVSNDLLEDTGDVMPVISECFGLTSKAQQNMEILKELGAIKSGKTVTIANTKTMADVEAIDAIRTAILTKLTGVNRAKAKIVVCDSDFAKLAMIKDDNGHPYLCPDVTNPSIYRIEGHEVIAIDDQYMTSAGTVGGYAWVGNFERIAIFDRKGIEVSANTSALFTKDAVAVKGKKRFDVKVLEAGAFVKVK